MVIASTLADINNAQLALERSTRELGSGKSILEPSDNPVGTSQAISLQSSLDGLTSYEKSAQDGTAWLETATGSISGIEQVTQRVRELVLQASNSNNSQSDLNSIASEVEQLVETVKQDANTQYAGLYVFSGSATATAPDTQGESDAYHGNTGTITRTPGPGASVPVTVSLSSVLGEGKAAGDGKLLDTMRTIVAHLREGNTKALSEEDLGHLDANMGSLTSLEAQVGSYTDQLKAAVSRIEDLRNATTAQLSNVQDANIAQVTTEYSSQQAALNAALHADASIVQQSLLEFLH
jgi:flagellar hook-associated protein 3 FlgL